MAKSGLAQVELFRLLVYCMQKFYLNQINGHKTPNYLEVRIALGFKLGVVYFRGCSITHEFFPP
jgi:hypothetical protein